MRVDGTARVWWALRSRAGVGIALSPLPAQSTAHQPVRYISNGAGTEITFCFPRLHFPVS